MHKETIDAILFYLNKMDSIEQLKMWVAEKRNVRTKFKMIAVEPVQAQRQPRQGQNNDAISRTEYSSDGLPQN